jgi:hypothetical protein
VKHPLLRDIVAAVLLFALNAWIAWRLFLVSYTPAWSSIEGAFVGLARHISLHWGDFSWWTIWRCGMPYQDTYVPLLHLVVAAVATIAKWPAAHAYHAVLGVTYSLGAVTLYVLARRLDAERPAAVFAGLVYSLFSPSAFILPEFGVDLGNPLAGRRLQVMTVYGEGPHVSAIALIPLALLVLEYAVRRRTGRSLALASLALGAVFITNIPGTMGLALAVFCWIAVQPGATRFAALRIAATAAVLGYAVVCFAVPPSSLVTVFGNVGPMHSGFSTALHRTPYLLPLVLVATAGVGWLLARTFLPLYARFGALYAAMTALLVLTARHSERFEILPQAGRLHLEMELGIALVAAWLLWLFYRSGRSARYVLAVFGLAAMYYQVGHYRWRARMDLKPVDPTTRSEYTSAHWLDTHMNGRRVYATGSTGFWLNAFTDTPQMTGCCDQGNSMAALASVPYLIHAGIAPAQTRTGIEWLQTMGIHAIVVNGPESNDEYKDYQKPERFENFLPVLHRERGDTIYGIPQRSASLAHVIRPEEAPSDRDRSRYVAAIEDPARPEAACDWLAAGRARIRARLNPGDAVSVQTAWFHGWRASSNGAAVPVDRDGIGFLLLRPACTGDCTIDLRWTGPRDFYLAGMVSAAGIALAAWLALRRRSI